MEYSLTDPEHRNPKGENVLILVLMEYSLTLGSEQVSVARFAS